jgi:hypothetical protein
MHLYDVQVSYFKRDGGVVIVTVLQAGKPGKCREIPSTGKHYFNPHSMYIVMG